MRSLWKIKHGVRIYTLGIHTYRPILYLIHRYYYFTLGLILTVFRNTWVPIHILVAHVHNKKFVINLVSVWFLWRLYWDRECKEIKFRPCDTFHPMTLHHFIQGKANIHVHRYSLTKLSCVPDILVQAFITIFSRIFSKDLIFAFFVCFWQYDTESMNELECLNSAENSINYLICTHLWFFIYRGI